MGAGKYSPTVSFAYAKDQQWWDKNNSNKDSNYDDDGYDRYGYDINDVDRAGNHEDDYMMGEWINDEYCYVRYEQTALEWNGKNCVGVKYVG